MKQLFFTLTLGLSTLFIPLVARADHLGTTAAKPPMVAPVYAPRMAYAPQPVVAQPSYVNPTYVQPTYVQPTYVRPVYGRPVYTRSLYSRPVYSRPIVYGRPVYTRPANIRPAHGRPVIVQPPAVGFRDRDGDGRIDRGVSPRQGRPVFARGDR